MSHITLGCWLLLALMGWAGATAPAWGQATSAPVAAKKSTNSGPSWSSLTAQQRQALSPLERDWPSLEASRKTKWLEVAVRFPAMPQADQQRVQERMAEWARMTPAERGRARLSFQESKQFSPEQKQARWEAYQALPDDERRALANRNQTSAIPAPSGANSGKTAATSQLPKPQAKAVATGPDAAPVTRPAASGPAVRPVAPTMVQAKPGATTTLMTTSAEPPAHHRPGQPKIAAKPGQVDSSTLLPQSGPQATASSPRLP